MSGRKTIEEAIAVINSGGDESVDEGFCRRNGQSGAETGNMLEVKEGCFSDLRMCGWEERVMSKINPRFLI